MADIEQLAETIGYLLDNDQAKNQLSSKISQLMQQQTSVVENYRDRLVAYYKNYF